MIALKCSLDRTTQIAGTFSSAITAGHIVSAGGVDGFALYSSAANGSNVIIVRAERAIADINGSLAINRGDALYSNASGQVNKTEASQSFVGYALQTVAAGATQIELLYEGVSTVRA